MADLTLQAGESALRGTMSVMLRFSMLPGVLLLAATPFALAESPMPDPVPPAVVGRPLDHTWSYRVDTGKPAPIRKEAKGPRPAQAARKASAPTQVLGAAPSSMQSATAHRAKQALDDRADTHTMLVDDVGEGTHFARKPLAPGVYFADRHRSAVRKYYQEHPLSGGAVHWQIGQPVPSGVPLEPVPQGLLASLPKLPPGHRYAELGGEVVLIASGSKMVVDGISRTR
jgi:hypothetical protein